MKRIWSIRINLDEFNSLVGMAFTDRDKAEILVGLAAGMNKAQIPEQCSSGVRAAFEIGSAWRSEAEGFQTKQADAGKASAEARKAKYGDAQPSNGVRTVIEPASNLTLNLNPLTVQPEKRSSPSRARSPRKREEIPPIPDDLLPFLEELKTYWPRKSLEKGVTRRVTILRPVDSWEKICKNRGTDEPRVCINAGLAYLDTHPTEYVIGMDNFFGQARKYTKFVVED